MPSTTPVSVRHPSAQHPSAQHPSTQHPSTQHPSTQHPSTQNLRVTRIESLPLPRELAQELPLTERRAALVERSRAQIEGILNGTDDRLLVIVGPCSVHDPVAALEYAHRLAVVAQAHREELLIVMRVYFEKPRSTGGWKGLINDPYLNGTHRVADGLRMARSLLLDVLDAGLPVGCEFLEPTSPQYIADAVSWGAIGARTTESQIHRQLASGLSMPVGFKNATDGDVQVAIDGCTVAGQSQVFFGVDDDGAAAVVSTTGNEATHIILRGGRRAPNYGAADVAAAIAALRRAGRPGRVVVDASHANSGKDHVRQAQVALELADRIAAGEPIAGIMLESFLEPGRQELTDAGAAGLAYGLSITDACIGWSDTVRVLDALAAASGARMSPALVRRQS